MHVLISEEAGVVGSSEQESKTNERGLCTASSSLQKASLVSFDSVAADTHRLSWKVNLGHTGWRHFQVQRDPHPSVPLKPVSGTCRVSK